MNSDLLEFTILCITTLFAMINPIGVSAIFIGITGHLPPRQVQHVALKSVLTAFVILVTFALFGSLIFKAFSISLQNLKIVAGVLFFLLGYEMIQARISRTKMDKPEDMADMHEYTQNIAITPLAIPLISGPGSIATVVILMEQYQNLIHRSVLFLSILLVLIVTYCFLRFAHPLMSFLGPSGSKVLTRIMGLIVMLMAVEYFFAGLKPTIRDIMNIPLGI